MCCNPIPPSFFGLGECCLLDVSECPLKNEVGDFFVYFFEESVWNFKNGACIN